ncbi:MAG: TlpA disulfide reductase family protein, partial [Bacteroidales bacterium]
MIKKYILSILFLLVSMSPGFSQDLTKIGSDDLKSLLNDSSDKLHIINFWATWCSPCVTELPYFEEAAQKFEGEDVEFTLVNLDFPSQVESRLVPFLEEKKITLKVLLMEELDYDK